MPWQVDYPPVPRPNGVTRSQVNVPDLCTCVYFFWRGDTCVYVGRTENLRRRLKNHKKYVDRDQITWINFPKVELPRAEGFYIWLLHPRRNFFANWEWYEQREKLKKQHPWNRGPQNRLYHTSWVD